MRFLARAMTHAIAVTTRAMRQDDGLFFDYSPAGSLERATIAAGPNRGKSWIDKAILPPAAG
jgi:hypothetical protein